MTSFKINQTGLDALASDIGAKATARYNRVLAQVEATHSGRPISEVRDALARAFTGDGFTSNREAMREDAKRISSLPPIGDKTDG